MARRVALLLQAVTPVEKISRAFDACTDRFLPCGPVRPDALRFVDIDAAAVAADIEPRLVASQFIAMRDDANQVTAVLELLLFDALVFGKFAHGDHDGNVG
jgi:hypothetical protein